MGFQVFLHSDRHGVTNEPGGPILIGKHQLAPDLAHVPHHAVGQHTQKNVRAHLEPLEHLARSHANLVFARLDTQLDLDLALRIINDMYRRFIDSQLMLTTISRPSQSLVSSALLVILVASVVLQAVAAWIALSQTDRVIGRYRVAWIFVGVALMFMVERRLAPLWRQIHSGEESNFTDAVFGMVISCLMVAGMYGIKEVFTDLRSQANTDELTGLANRRSIIDHAQYEIDRAVRTKRPLALLMFDIDRFKLVNDSYGHPAGDVVLRLVANIARATFRHIDSIGRIGGEEFLAVLPESDREKATAAAERFRNAIASERFSFGGKQASITMSIGVAIRDLTAGSVALKDILEAADRALYSAKNGGRNRVVVDEPIKPVA